jgi:hypothetical protein
MPMHGGERRIDGVFLFASLGVLLAVALTPAWRTRPAHWLLPAASALVSAAVWYVYKTPISPLWPAWGAAVLGGWAMTLPDTKPVPAERSAVLRVVRPHAQAA